MIAKGVYSRLGTSGISTITDRVYPKVAPLNVRAPFIIYGVDSDMSDTLFDGAETLRQSFIDVDCYAKEYLKAHELAAAVETAFVDYRGALTSALTAEYIRLERKFDLFEADTQLYRVSLQLYIAYY